MSILGDDQEFLGSNEFLKEVQEYFIITKSKSPNKEENTMKLRKIQCSISLLLSCILAMHSGILQSLMVNAEFINDGSTICSTPEEKIDSAVYDSITSGEENIPVVIWYKDIDQAYVESETTKRVGFSLEEIEVTYEPPSSELLTALNEAAVALDNSVSATTIIGEQTELNALDSTAQMNSNKLDSYLKLLMNTHMEMTESARELERNRTESYLEAKSEIVKEQYSLASAEMKTALSLNDDEALFASCYAPMLVCELTADEIFEISQNDDVVEISYLEPLEIEECSLPVTQAEKNKLINSMGFQNIQTELGLTGSGVGIGIYETSNVSADYAPTYNLPFNDSKIHIIGQSHVQGDHATYCAAVAAGTYGVAPEAEIYSASVEYDYHRYNADADDTAATLLELQELVESGVHIINISWLGHIHDGTTQNSYSYWEKYIDYLVNNHNVTFVISSGNDQTKYISSPALAYNAITVNGFTSNELQTYSYLHGEGCHKPDVIAECFSYAGGTSTAAPVISGMIALLYQYKPSLMAYPQVVKAILMASSHQKMTHLEDGTALSSESLALGLTNRQGAGVPNMYRMISMAAAHTYGIGTLSDSNEYAENINFVQPKYNGTNINVCMAYLQTNVLTTSPASTADNCNLSLNYGNGVRVSTKTNSSTEMIYKTMPSTSDYILTINRKSGTSTEISYGYAWSTDTTEFYQYRDEEGIYYLKNANSSKCLNMNNSTLAASQGAFDSTSSPWVLKYSYSNNKYTIQSANETDKGLTLGSSLSGGYRAVGTTSTYTPSITMSQNTDGTYTFIQNRNGTKYALGIYSSSQNNNAVAMWSPFTPETSNSNEPTDKSQKWYLSTLAYRKGDVNMDGAINSIDASAALSIGSQLGASGSTTYSNASLFLADYDNDGSVNSIDASIIMQNYT